MPLLNIDGQDPLALLAAWSEVVATALGAQLANQARFTAEPFSTPRAGVVVSGGVSPDAATLVAPARFTDRIGVSINDLAGGQAAAVVLFVTPDNKADSDASLAFAVCAAGFMASGAGAVIVDILPGPPSWATHLHSLTGVYPLPRRPRGGEAPVLAVHPRIEDGAERYAVWHHAVATGSPLATVPVPVRGAMHLTLDLEATYAEACERVRVP